MENIETEQIGEDILGFRNQLLAKEILSSGVGHLDSILHLGAGSLDSTVFSFLADLKANNAVQGMDVKYNAVDVQQEALDKIATVNEKLAEPIYVNLHNVSAQEFLDNNSTEYTWTIISGIFDRNEYGEQQFQFVDKILAESLKVTTEGVIFTIDSRKQGDVFYYSIEQIIAYIQSTYSRYRISRVNEYDYVFCVYKYYHSLVK